MTMPSSPSEFLTTAQAAAGSHVGGLSKKFLLQLQQETANTFARAVLILDNSGSTINKADGKIYHCADYASAGYRLEKQQQRIKEIAQRARDSLAVYRLMGLPCTVAALNTSASSVPADQGAVPRPQSTLAATCTFDGTYQSYQACLAYIQAMEDELIQEKKYFGTPLCGVIDRTLPLNESDDSAGIIVNIICDGVPSDVQPGHSPAAVLSAMLQQRAANYKGINVVVNLVTDDENTINTYNDCDVGSKTNGKCRLDVIDDPHGEASEIGENNRGLAYTLPLHLLRQAGVVAHKATFNVLDERELTADELLAYASELLGIDRARLNDLALLPENLERIPLVNKNARNASGQPMINHDLLAKAIISKQARFAFPFGFIGSIYRFGCYVKLLCGGYKPDNIQYQKTWNIDATTVQTGSEAVVLRIPENSAAAVSLQYESVSNSCGASNAAPFTPHYEYQQQQRADSANGSGMAPQFASQHAGREQHPKSAIPVPDNRYAR